MKISLWLVQNFFVISLKGHSVEFTLLQAIFHCKLTTRDRRPAQVFKTAIWDEWSGSEDFRSFVAVVTFQLILKIEKHSMTA